MKAVIKILGLIIFFSFLGNVVWENLQAPLYQGYGSFWQHFPVCFWGTIGDVVIVLVLYLAITVWYRDWYWIKDLSLRSVITLGILGLAIGAGIELRALSAAQWAYTPAMPVIPGLGVGLLPVLQMMILPGLTFFLAAKILKR